MKPLKTIIITGSHHTPAIELIHQLRSDQTTDWHIHYLAHIFPSETHLTHTIIPKLNINFHPISSGKFDRRFIGKTIKGIPATIKAIFRSFFLLRQIKPNIVISFGGYISVPVIIAAKILGIKSIIHEQTLTNSLATRICALFVNKIALSFNQPSQIKQLPANKVVVTGNLIRQEIFSHSSKPFAKLKPPLIYITGGSQGSSTINNFIVQLLPQLKKFTIIHQTGPLDYEKIVSQTKNFSNYHPTAYVNTEDIGWIFHHSQLIISRSGANICQELNILSLKSILIPHPYTQQNEQVLNAQWLQRQLPKTTIILDQFQLTPEKIITSIEILLKQPSNISTTPHLQNPKLLQLIYELV